MDEAKVLILDAAENFKEEEDKFNAMLEKIKVFMKIGE